MAKKPNQPADPETPEVPAAKRGGRKPTPENETARERFKRIAGLRLTNALDAIRLLGRIGEFHEQYEYSDNDVKIIVEKINAEFQTAVKLLAERKRREVAEQSELFA